MINKELRKSAQVEVVYYVFLENNQNQTTPEIINN